MPWSTDFDMWSIGMISGFDKVTRVPIAPDGWEAGIIPARVEVAAFLKRFPQHFNAMPKSDEERSGAWPSSRTWDMAGRLRAICKASGASEDASLMLLVGSVGRGPAVEFMKWAKELDIPDPEELLRDPEHFKLNTKRGDIAFAILSNVVAAYARKRTLQRWNASWVILRKAADGGAADIAASGVRMLLNNRRGDFPYPINDTTPFVTLMEEAKIMDGQST